MKRPASPHLLSEPAIIAGMAGAALPDSNTPWEWYIEDYDRIRDTMAQALNGFEDCNRRVRLPLGFRIKQPARELVFLTPTGRAEFSTATLPDVVHAHRVLDRGALDAAFLVVLLGPAQARQDERSPTVDEVAAVQFGAHADGEVARAQCLVGVDGVRCGEGEVAAHADEHLHIAAVHRLDGGDRVQAVLAGRVDLADLGQAVQELLGGPVVDAARPVALDIAVPSYR
jgi:hypothetical protein